MRGLDYYTRTVFEVQPENLGSQSTLGGGGRYDRLIEEIGGRGTPATGFATGIERVILNMKQQGVRVPPLAGPLAMLAYTDDASKREAVRISSQLSTAGLGSLVAGEGKSLKAQMRQANNLGISVVIIIGPEELASGSVIIRNLGDGSQEAVSLDRVVQEISKLAQVADV